jgi:HSP20 family molecular chaperone IbpA
MAIWRDPLFKLFEEELFPSSALVRQKGRASHEALANVRGNALAMNLSESPSEFTLSLDTPGLSKEQLAIEADDETGMVTVCAHFSHDKAGEGDKHHWVERSSGSVSRSVRLPDSADLEHMTAHESKGVLTLKVPKKAAQEVKPSKRQIQISSL